MQTHVMDEKPGVLELDVLSKIIQIQIPRKHYTSQIKHKVLLLVTYSWYKVIYRGTNRPMCN